MTTIPVKHSTHIEDLVGDMDHIVLGEVCDNCDRLTSNNSVEVFNNFCDGIEDVCDGDCGDTFPEEVEVTIGKPIDLASIPF